MKYLEIDKRGIKMSFQIITDSTADLDETWAKKNNVHILGLTIEINGTTYQTVGEDKLTTERLLTAMEAGNQPKTSQINVGVFQEVFGQYAKNEVPVLYIAFSSHFSGTYQSAQIAKEMVLTDFPNAKIEIIDSLAASGGEGLLVQLASRYQKEGKSIEEITLELKKMIPQLKTYFLVDDLYHLMRGGRLSKTAAVIGSLTNVKPLLTIGEDGKLATLAKIRGRKKALRELFNLATANKNERMAVIGYIDENNDVANLKAALEEQEEIREVFLVPLGPVISAHVGPGTLAIFKC